MSYEVLGETADAFHVKHPDGKIFPVAKKHISPATEKKIRGMYAGGRARFADGGEVEPLDETPAVQASMPPDGDAPAPATAPPPSLWDGVKNFAATGFMGDAPTAPGGGVLHTVGNLVRSGGMSTDDDTTPDAAPAPAPQPVRRSAPSAPEAPQAPTPARSFGTGGSGGAGRGPAVDSQAAELRGAEAQQVQGANAAAQAKADAGAREAEARQQEAEKLQAFMVDTQKQRAALADEHAKLFDAAMKQKIEPGNYWDSMSTPGKIGSAIAIVLGGIAGRGHGNQALDVINNAIARDVDAQKANLGQKNTLLADNFQKTKNLDEAMQLTTQQLQTITAAKVAQSAALAQGPEAQAAAQQLSGQLAQQTTMGVDALATARAKRSLDASEVSKNYAQAQKDRAGKLAKPVNTPDVDAALDSLNQMEKSFKRANKGVGGSVAQYFGGTDSAKYADFKQDALPLIAKAMFKTNRAPTPEMLKAAEERLPSMMTFGDKATDKFHAMRDALITQRNHAGPSTEGGAQSTAGLDAEED